MKLNFTWQPVLEKLPLTKYNPAASADDFLLVCVNISTELKERRLTLIREFQKRNQEQVVALTLLKSLDEKADETERSRRREAYMQALTSFNQWVQDEFDPGLDDWLAQVLSFGEDKYTVEEVTEWRKADEHFRNFLLSQCVQMIENHWLARDLKKNN